MRSKGDVSLPTTYPRKPTDSLLHIEESMSSLCHSFRSVPTGPLPFRSSSSEGNVPLELCQCSDDQHERQIAKIYPHTLQQWASIQEQDHLLNIAEADKARGEKAEVENRDLKVRLKRAKKEVTKLRMQLDKLMKVNCSC